jgi:hypothetical protein
MNRRNIHNVNKTSIPEVLNAICPLLNLNFTKLGDVSCVLKTNIVVYQKRQMRSCKHDVIAVTNKRIIYSWLQKKRKLSE